MPKKYTIKSFSNGFEFNPKKAPIRKTTTAAGISEEEGGIDNVHILYTDKHKVTVDLGDFEAVLNNGAWMLDESKGREMSKQVEMLTNQVKEMSETINFLQLRHTVLLNALTKITSDLINKENQLKNSRRKRH